MRRIKFEGLERISDFDVDVRLVHSKSSNISLVKLNNGESFEIEKSDFETHVVVLSGKVEMISEDIQDVFNSGCLSSILLGQNVYINSLESSRILVIRDDPTWVMKAIRRVRKFSNFSVPKDLILKIMDSARLASRFEGLQTLRVYLTSDPEKRKALSKLTYDQECVSKAPWIAVITILVDEDDGEGEQGKLCSVATNFALYVMLSAKAFGLDSCWIEKFDEESVRKVINTPEDERPVAVIPMGYAEKFLKVSERRPLDEILVEF